MNCLFNDDCEMSEAFYKVASYRIDKSETDPMALHMDTEIHAETTVLDNPDPTIIYSTYATEVGKKAEYKKKRVSKKVVKPTDLLDAEPVLETEPVVIVKPINNSACGVYGRGEKGVPRASRKKKVIVIDPAFNAVEVEIENLKIEETAVSCEIVPDIDELQMASLSG